MNALALRSNDPYAVRSLTFEQLADREPPLPLFYRLTSFVRVALMAWGAISLGAATGVAVYYWAGSEQTLLVDAQQATPKPGAAKPQMSRPQAAESQAPSPKPDRIAMAVAIAPTAEAVFGPAALPDLPLGITPPMADARLPRPRPDEPIITGSLGAPRYDPDYRPEHRRVVDPCLALRNLGAPVRCGRQTRVYRPVPPPPPGYYPRPYQAPIVIYE